MANIFQKLYKKLMIVNTLTYFPIPQILQLEVRLDNYYLLFRDILTILDSTSIWADKAIEDITESDYLSIVTSGIDLPILKNCSLEQELNQVR